MSVYLIKYNRYFVSANSIFLKLFKSSYDSFEFRKAPYFPKPSTGSIFGKMTSTTTCHIHCYKEEEKQVGVDFMEEKNKIKLIVYNSKFSTTNLVIYNNFSLLTTNAVYQFKCSSGDCFSNKISTYIDLNTTSLSRSWTFYLSDTSSISHHLKTHSCPSSKYRKIVTENSPLLHKIKKTPNSWNSLYIKMNLP